MEQPSFSAQGKAAVEARIVKPENRTVQDVCMLGTFSISIILSFIFGMIGVANYVGPQDWLNMYTTCLNIEPIKINTPGADQFFSSVQGAQDNGFNMMQKDPGIAVGVMFGVFAIAFLWLFLLRTYTRAMVWGTLAVSVLVIIIAGVAALSYELRNLGFMLLAVGILEAVFLAFVRKSVDVCADMLQLACEALIHYPSILASHMLLGLAVLVASLVTFVFMVMTQFNIVKVTGESCTETEFASYIGLFQAINWIGLCWFIGTLGAVRLFVSAFVAGQWYFHREEDRVQHATSKALLLAFTKSLGTLALAGIITALVNWAKRKVRKMKRTCNPVQCLFAYMLGCLLSCVEFLNTFATIVATVTGNSFFGAAKLSGPLLKSVFMDGFVTNRYGRFVLEVGAVAISVLGGFLVWYAFDQANNMNSTSEIGYAIIYILFALWQPWGMMLGFIFAFFLEGGLALVGLAAVIAGVARFTLLFLVNTLLDITNAMFTFYAIDKANATISGEQGAKLHGVVGTFVTASGQVTSPVPTQPSALGVPTAQPPYAAQNNANVQMGCLNPAHAGKV